MKIFSLFHVISEAVPAVSALSDIQGVPGGKDLTSGECSLGQTITI